MSPTFYPRWVEANTISKTTIAPTDSLFKRHFESITNDPLQYSHGLKGVDQRGNFLWSNVLVLCFVVLLVVTLALHLTGRTVAYFRQISSIGGMRQAYWSQNRTQWWPWMQRHIFMAPLGKSRHNEEMKLGTAVSMGTVPGRFQMILLVIYILSNIAYVLALPYHDPEPKAKVAALRGRCGVLAVLNLIPTVLFALRNNPLIPLLRVSYDDFNLLHRWCARMVILHSTVHILAWLGNTLASGGGNAVKKCFQDSSYVWGLVGGIFFLVILVQAWAPIRKAAYETFLNGHRLMVFFAILGTYMHLDKHTLPGLRWLQLSWALWCLEWVVRFIRIAYYNINMGNVTQIKVEAMPAEACRVTVYLNRPWKPVPGCHAHLYMPRLGLWSSHPFSIAWSDTSSQPTTLRLPISEKGEAPREAPFESRQVSFICRAREGLTRTMYDKASAAPNNTLEFWGAMEGPYGGNHSLDSYGTVVLMANGVGITHQVMYCRHLVEGFAQNTVATKKILLLWTIPDTECLEWIRPWMDSILSLPRRKEILRIMIFVSRPKAPVRSASSHLQMFPGRPDLATLLDREIADREGAMAVTACGSGTFSDSVRKAVRSRVEVGNIDYIEEAFTY